MTNRIQNSDYSIKATVKSFVRAAALVATMLVVSACGGGSEESSESSPAPSPNGAPSTNSAPTANAGSPKSVNAQATVTLSGSGTDSDGSIASYNWTQTVGLPVKVANANSASANFDAPNSATQIILTFQLVVTDHDGSSATDTVDIAVNPIVNLAPTAYDGPDQWVNEQTVVTLTGIGRNGAKKDKTKQTGNITPTAYAGADQSVNEQTTVTLTGAGADNDGTVVSYSWIQTTGSVVILSNKDDATTTFTAPRTNTQLALSFDLAVTDNKGAVATDSVTITVDPVANIAPIANAGVDQKVNEQTQVSLLGNGADSDGRIASYAWTQIAGETITLTNANSAATGFTAPRTATELTLGFQLTVTDNEGSASIDTVYITVTPVANIAPTANAGPDQAVAGQTSVSLSGSGNDSDGNVVSFRWAQIAGQSVSLTTTINALTSFESPISTSPMTLAFQLTVVDNEGATTSDTVNIIVNATENIAPTADAGADQTVNELTTVILSGNGADADGSVAIYRWAQTAGQSVTLANTNSASTSFSAPSVETQSTLTFQFTVTDNDGAETTDTINVTVNPIANLAPTAFAGADQTVNEQTVVTLSGNGSDNDGTVASYHWIQIAGDVVTLSNPNSASTNFTSPNVSTQQTLRFQLAVTDNEADTTNDEINIIVNPRANETPIANAGADQSVDEQTIVNLLGSGVDNDGTVASYLWTQIAGDAVALTNADNASTSFTAPNVINEVVLTFRLTVTDDEGATTTDFIDITIIPSAPPSLAITTANNNNDLVVSWNDVGGDLYRVLFWANDGNVYDPTTTDLSLTIVAAQRELGGSIVVEVYDPLGNSVFSIPMSVDAL